MSALWDLVLGLGCAWALCSLFILALMTFRPQWLAPPAAPAFVIGLWRPRVMLAWWLPRVLTEEEQEAVGAHEFAHIALGHLRSNALRAILLPVWRRSEREAYRQELEADFWAAERGHGPALARALRKLSDDPADLRRAEFLEKGYSERTLASGKGGAA